MRGKGETAATDYEPIPIRMHPRVFAALGADLVTNDVVAVIELVKNSYDAFARHVWIRFFSDEDGNPVLEIKDDGKGMTRNIIEEVWCMVASPFKEDNPFAKDGTKTRRVAGEKGLGRLAAARLGDRLHILTKAPNDLCWEVEVDWPELAAATELAACFAKCRKYAGSSPFETSGTRLHIVGLKGKWNSDRVSDLEENLARLISPFSKRSEFNIFLSGPGDAEADSVRIQSPSFLSQPKYLMKGEVDGKGNISCAYRFTPIRNGEPRSHDLKLTWDQIFDNIQDRARQPFEEAEAHCGPFSFEIRAWDIAPEDTEEISERFEFQKSRVRKAIRAHKGISVYRDGVLVLPKSDTARDWLGLDLRRVSKVGTRMSTSQLVGYVAISAEMNPGIADTSDRERLVSRLEVAEFEEILKTITALLENERDEDRTRRASEPPLQDLFERLSASEMVAEVVALAEEGAEVAEAVPILRAFSEKLEGARKAIQERFVFYSRMATVGTIAQMLVHEIRNRTTAIGSFLEFFRSRFGPFRDQILEDHWRSADGAVNALERLADTFSPLASRGYRRRQRDSILEDRIHECLALNAGEIGRKSVRVRVPSSKTQVAVDPGELDAILLNLINNAVYWLSQMPKEERDLEFRLGLIGGGTRVRVWVHDSGPGLREEDLEKVFWPGVTRKPGGIGMGLTVSAELVAEYGGRMSAKHPGTLGGASFAFDLPLRRKP